MFIQNDCYYISKTKANWYIANNECSRRNAMLMNTNNHSELRNIHSYLVQNNLIKNFIRSHLKLEISSHRNVNNQSNGEKVFNYKKIQLSDDSRLKDRLCKSDRSGILHLKGEFQQINRFYIALTNLVTFVKGQILYNSAISNHMKFLK